MLKFRFDFLAVPIRTLSNRLPIQNQICNFAVDGVCTQSARQLLAAPSYFKFIHHQISFSMSKGNLFLGLARGSVGDVTFYRRNAQQITRVRVRKIKNPQSPAQMGQRAIQRTAVQAYSVLKQICDHSYEGVSYGASSYSKFLSLNMEMLRYEAAHPTQEVGNRSFVPHGFQGLAAMPYAIARGTIPAPAVIFASATVSGEEVTALVFGGQFGATAGKTYAQMAQWFGAQQGDQITILKVPANHFEDEPLGRELILCRFILDPEHGEFEETEFFGSAGSDGTYRINDPNQRNEGTARFALTAGGSLLATADTFTQEDMGLAFIISRQKEDGTWLRSNANLLYNPTWRENGYTLKQASTLEPADVVVESDYYLNNAE